MNAVFASCKWLFFDVGDTLMDETEAHRFRVEATIVNMEQKQLAHPTTDAFMAQLQQLYVRYDKGYPDILKQYGAEDCYVSYQLPIIKRKERLFPHTEEILCALHTRYRMGIIANQPKETPQYLEENGIAQFFDPLIISARVGLGKPDPAFFRLGLEAAAAEGILPAECVMIGDRLDRDIYPAKRLGMKTIRIKKGFFAREIPDDAAHTPDAEVDTLSDLLSILF